MNPLHQRLAQLKLSGVKAALKQQAHQDNLYLEQSFEERLSLLLTHEITGREQRRVERVIKQARFRLKASINDIDYTVHRKLSKNMVRELAHGEWLRRGQNLLITGTTGCGKTYLSFALGHHHCQQKHSVYYFRQKRTTGKTLYGTGGRKLPQTNQQTQSL